MPNRVLKENLLLSRKLAGLSWFEQAVYVRLILSCDDYGLYYASPDIIRGRLFCLSREVRVEDVEEAMDHLEQAELICRYQADGELYFFMPDWDKHQTAKNKRTKYPAPPALREGPRISAQNPIQSASETKTESESVSESASESESGDGAAEAADREIWEDYGRICVGCQPCRNLTGERRKKLGELRSRGYTPEVFREAFRKVQQSSFLLQRKKVPVNLDWLLKEENLVKVLEDHYADRPPAGQESPYSRLGEFERLAIARCLEEARREQALGEGLDAELPGAERL